MSAGRVPEDHTSGLTGGPQPRPASADAAEAAFPAAPVPRFPRLQALAGLTVKGRDDRTVGRVRDIYQQDASGALAAITVVPRQLSSRAVLVPAAAIETLPPFGAQHEDARRDTRADAGPDSVAGPDAGAGSASASSEGSGAGSRPGSGEDSVVRLRVDAATARAGKRPPEIAHVTPQQMREAAEALGLEAAGHLGDPVEPRGPSSAELRDRSSAESLDAADAPHPVEPR